MYSIPNQRDYLITILSQNILFQLYPFFTEFISSAFIIFYYYYDIIILLIIDIFFLSLLPQFIFITSDANSFPVCPVLCVSLSEYFFFILLSVFQSRAHRCHVILETRYQNEITFISYIYFLSQKYSLAQVTIFITQKL